MNYLLRGKVTQLDLKFYCYLTNQSNKLNKRTDGWMNGWIWLENSRQKLGRGRIIINEKNHGSFMAITMIFVR